MKFSVKRVKIIPVYKLELKNKIPALLQCINNSNFFSSFQLVHARILEKKIHFSSLFCALVTFTRHRDDHFCSLLACFCLNIPAKTRKSRAKNYPYKNNFFLEKKKKTLNCPSYFFPEFFFCSALQKTHIYIYHDYCVRCGSKILLFPYLKKKFVNEARKNKKQKHDYKIIYAPALCSAANTKYQPNKKRSCKIIGGKFVALKVHSLFLVTI